MKTLEERQAIVDVFNIKELALGSLQNRGNFITKNRLGEFEKGEEKYCSVYNFKESIKEYYTQEIYNSKGILIKPKKSLSLFSGEVASDFLIIDIDYELSLKIAQQAAKDLIEVLTRNGLDRRHIKIYFSGNKGFHIYLPAYLFNHFCPAGNLPIIHKRIVEKLSKSINRNYEKEVKKNNNKEIIDTSIYGSTRMIRLSNSLNTKGNLYKIELTYEELYSFDIKMIKALAKVPRLLEKTTVEPAADVYLEDMYQTVSMKSAIEKTDPERTDDTADQSYAFADVVDLEIEKLQNIQDSCKWFNGICEKSADHGNIIHRDRISLAQLLIAFGIEGKRQVHNLLKNTSNYDENKTEKNLDSLIAKGFKPPLCCTLCPEGLCSKMIERGKKSPIAFAMSKKKEGDLIDFNETVLTDKIIEKYPQLRYSLNEYDFYNYESGAYKRYSENEIFGLINDVASEFVNPGEVTAHRNKGTCERLKMMSSVLLKKEFNNEKYLINLNNGIYDLRSGELVPHSPSLLSTIQLSFNYDPKAKAPRFEAFLNDILSGDPDTIEFVLKTMCYFLIPDYSFQKIFIFLGDGRNGKGVLSNIIKELIGEANVSGLSAHELAINKFAPVNLKNKLINISSEIDNTELGMSMLKRLSGGDLISGDRKFKTIDNFYNKARLLILTNSLPRFSEVGTAILERFILIHFKKKFLGTNDDPNLTNDLKEELPGIFNLVISKVPEILKGGGIKYEVPAVIQGNRKILLGEISSVAEFIQNHCERTEDNSYVALKNLYEEYTSFCKECSYMAKGYRTFINEIEVALDLTTGKKEIGKVVFNLRSRSLRIRLRYPEIICNN